LSGKFAQYNASALIPFAPTQSFDPGVFELLELDGVLGGNRG
jgi:hypothetical protein